ncbi:S1C family serine protease [Micromonosporaceae bacterium DT55]|uniref:S1C family serine protease n=1 Tax=Melissospora conviva TaxID=3388432 RepID=UPI003C1FE18D
MISGSAAGPASGSASVPVSPGRPGPLPPRIEPPARAYPQAAPAGAYPPPAGAYPPPAAPGQPQPVAPSPPTGPASPQFGAAAAPAGWQSSSPPQPPAFPPPAQPSAPQPSARGSRRSWPGLVAFVLVLLLAGVAGFQTFQLDRLGDRLAELDSRAAAGQENDTLRLDGLETRTEELEEAAGSAFNPEAIAGAALPSVFRVRAGDFTGTAFAVGKPRSGGGTNLLTNHHVVESVWAAGGRTVYLERSDQRYPATIVEVDEANDLAHLSTDAEFKGLAAAPEQVKSGQQIVVVGAPLGLTDTVTTGVVSAFRTEQDAGPTIQFDAPINPGNSGGPVINSAKQVVGIATAKAIDAEGIGLAVPIKTACDRFTVC